MAISEDRLTASVQEGGSGRYVGVLGSTTYTTGLHHFAIQVTEPVDDAFWIGIAYPDYVYCDTKPKDNQYAILWSGGDGKGRPGTIRLHGAKLREQRPYGTGDVIGIVINAEYGDISFYLNGEQTT